MSFEIKKLSFDKEVECKRVDIYANEIVFSYYQPCFGVLFVKRGYPEIVVKLTLKDIIAEKKYVDLEDILTIDAIKMFERTYEAEDLKELSLEERKQLIGEIDTDIDIDFDKIAENLCKERLYDGDLYEAGGYVEGLEFIYGSKPDWIYDGLTVRFEVDDEDVLSYLYAFYKGTNYDYDCIYNGEFAISFSFLEEAEEYMEETFKQLIDRGRYDEIDWEECSIGKREWYMSSLDLPMVNNHIRYEYESGEFETVWNGTDSPLYDPEHESEG